MLVAESRPWDTYLTLGDHHWGHNAYEVSARVRVRLTLRDKLRDEGV